MKPNLTEAEIPKYAYYQRLRRSCYLRDVYPQEATAYFLTAYGHLPPDTWNSVNVVPECASENEKQKYAEYLTKTLNVAEL